MSIAILGSSGGGKSTGANGLRTNFHKEASLRTDVSYPANSSRISNSSANAQIYPGFILKGKEVKVIDFTGIPYNRGPFEPIQFSLPHPIQFTPELSKQLGYKYPSVAIVFANALLFYSRPGFGVLEKTQEQIQVTREIISRLQSDGIAIIVALTRKDFINPDFYEMVKEKAVLELRFIEKQNVCLLENYLSQTQRCLTIDQDYQILWKKAEDKFEASEKKFVLEIVDARYIKCSDENEFQIITHQMRRRINNCCISIPASEVFSQLNIRPYEGRFYGRYEGYLKIEWTFDGKRTISRIQDTEAVNLPSLQ